MFNLKYVFVTFSVVGILMLGYNYGFNSLHHAKKVYVFQEMLKILYNTKKSEIQYLNLENLKSKIKDCSFEICFHNKEYFENIVLSNGWEKLRNSNGETVFTKGKYTLLYKEGEYKDTIYCEISYRGVDDDE